MVSSRTWKRAALAALVAGLGVAPSCAAEDDPPSQVLTLRVLAVTTDLPYAQRGDEVELRLTYADGLDAPDAPRPVQVAWIGGCFNPEGGNYAECYAQLAAAGGPQGDLQDLGPEVSGVPDAVSFTLAVPNDVLEKAPPIQSGTRFATAYVFFAVCAGTVREAETVSGSFPLECVGADGRVLGPDSFIVGYTQIYVFEDLRENTVPATTGIRFAGAAPVEGEVPVVPRCPSAGDDTTQGCGNEAEGDACRTFDLEAIVDPAEVADEDPSSGEAGDKLREVVWVNYYADAGEFDGAVKLISDAREGYLGDHATTWTPPAEPGFVSLWAVVHDSRGGASIARRVVQVE